jgi:uncharacterized protein
MFGAFVDIGIKENGLLHISEMSNSFVENAMDVLKVGQELKVKVLGIDMDRKRMSLSCKSDSKGEGITGVKTQGAPSGKRPHAGGGQPQMPQNQFKNNAFAGLKDLKLK